MLWFRPLRLVYVRVSVRISSQHDLVIRSLCQLCEVLWCLPHSTVQQPFSVHHLWLYEGFAVYLSLERCLFSHRWTWKPRTCLWYFLVALCHCVAVTLVCRVSYFAVILSKAHSFWMSRIIFTCIIFIYLNLIFDFESGFLISFDFCLRKLLLCWPTRLLELQGTF